MTDYKVLMEFIILHQGIINCFTFASYHQDSDARTLSGAVQAVVELHKLYVETLLKMKGIN